MRKCRVPLWGVLTPLQALVLVAAVLGTFWFLYDPVRALIAWNYVHTSDLLQTNMWTTADELLWDLKQTALAVYYNDPQLTVCAMPAGNYSPGGMARLFDAMTNTRRPLGSLGIIQRAPNTTNGKVSWQIAAGYGCPTTMYAACEPATYPAFLGWCVMSGTGRQVNTTAAPAYSGVDWGLESQEAQLLYTTPAAQVYPNNDMFKPIFPLLGYFTLTYERAIFCGNGTVPYAAVFAEQSLAKLDVSLADLTRNMSGVSVIVERATGLLVAASMANQTQVVVWNNSTNRTDVLRVHLCFNATAPELQLLCVNIGGAATIATITDPAGYEWTDSDQWVTAVPYTDVAGIDWVMFTSQPQSGYLVAVRNGSKYIGAIVAGVVLLGVMLTFAITYGCITLPLRQIGQAASSTAAAAAAADGPKVKESYIMLEVQEIADTFHDQ